MSKADLVRDLFLNPVEAHLTLFPSRHPYDSPPFHKEMIRLYWSSDPRVVILSFRGSAKSTLAEETIALKALIHGFGGRARHP